ncbi:MAG: rhodanese-like domain-containing protein [Verrucomicrobiota bacterium]|nr:rhodanese-like domain-containing protein [Verrucomicrobiota bacterium]
MRSWLRQAIILVCLAFLPAIGQALYKRDQIVWDNQAVAADEVTLDQVKAWGENVLWVDARPDAQFEKQHVPGAISLNEDRWNELLPPMLTAWTPAKRTIVYCSSQSCALSHEVAKRLREEAHLTNIFVLHGGWEAWLEAHQ